MTNSKKEHVKMTNNRPPSCDLLAEDKNHKLKECFNCGSPKVALIQCEGCFAGCDICFSQGPEDDPHGHKWNSIPRRSEVLELIRLVDGYFAGKTDPLDLRICATKLREEVGE